MSADVLHHERLANAQVKPAENPKSNLEWTVFSDSNEPLKLKPKEIRQQRQGRSTTSTPTGSNPAAETPK